MNMASGRLSYLVKNLTRYTSRFTNNCLQLSFEGCAPSRVKCDPAVQ